MRRGILIVVGLCIAAGFSFYILDIKPQVAVVYPDDGIQTGNMDTTYLAKETQSTPAPASIVPTYTTVDKDINTIAGEGWESVWSDDFNGPYLDLERWTEVDRKDNYNNELQYYTPANSYIKGGCLYLTAKKEKKEGKAYTSAMVQTMYKCSFCYGRIEARMKMPLGTGIFPAFWLITYEGKNEIDIMEMIGNEPNIFYGVVHYIKDGQWQKDLDMMEIKSPELFHVYALEWEPEEVRWYVDDELFFRTKQGIPTQDMYIIFTLAVGGDWPGTPTNSTQFPCSLIIDYVRLYQQK